MTSYENGDVVLVPFPFSDLKTTKRRPAVVISSTRYNIHSLDIVIMAITSKATKILGMGESLIEDWETSGLLKPSAIKPAIATIEQNLVVKKLGKLTSNDYHSIKIELQNLFEL